jgi:hypothetical protein
MKRFITIAISLLLFANSTVAQGHAPETLPASENLTRAEQLADSFYQRFRETLDFKVVYREFFITDAGKRLRNSAAIVFDSEDPGEMRKELSPLEIEQAYTGFMNLYYLLALYVSNFVTEEEESDGDIKSGELFPPELLSAMKEPAACFFFTDYIENPSCKDLPKPFQTAEDVRRFAKQAHHLAELFRKYMPPEPFNSPKYKAFVGQLDWDGRETSVSQKVDYFETGEETTVYQVYRGPFALDVVEENGEMRVAGIPLGN